MGESEWRAKVGYVVVVGRERECTRLRGERHPKGGKSDVTVWSGPRGARRRHKFLVSSGQPVQQFR